MSKRSDVATDAVLALLQKNYSMCAIAKELDCTVSVVKNRLAKLGYDSCNKSEGCSRHYAVAADEQWNNIKQDLDNGYDIVFLQQKYHMTKQRLLDLFDRQNYDYDRAQNVKKENLQKELQQKLEKLRCEGKTCAEIADILGKSKRTVSRYLRNLNLTSTTNRDDVKDDEIISEYQAGYTINEIAEKHKCSHDTITKRLNKHGIVCDRVSGIKRHFERTHEELWPDVKHMLDCGFGLAPIATKYKLRTDNIEWLMVKHNYKKAEDTSVQELLGLLQVQENPREVSDDMFRLYRDSIAEYYDEYDCPPTIYQLAKELDLPPMRVRRMIDKCGLCHFIKYVSISDYEAKLIESLEELGIVYDINNHDVLISNDGQWYELDIFLPDINLGIEVNPTFTHSIDTSHGVTKRDYHQQKSLLAEKCNIGLIHLYEDDLFDEKKFNKLLLQIQARQLERQTIGARLCQVRVIDRKLCNNFLDQYHFQGPINVKCISYGLFCDEVLVAVLVFAQSRYTDHDYEIVRYCTNPYYIVNGCFQKLFHAFLKTLKTSTHIVSYMDLNKRFSATNIYEKNGFVLEKITEPDYAWYHLTKQEMLSRYQTTKAKLVAQGFDAMKTEKEIMMERGFVRVFRAGSKRYVYNYIPTCEV